MERIITVLSLLLCGAVTLWGGYYLVTALASWRRPQGYGAHRAKTRFAVLIAARNEELVIGPLVHSLLDQDYPSELYDIWVIPNNCTDHTADAARAAGAKVLECRLPVKSKGEVLRFAYQRLKARQYNAFCIFDADNLADSRFLAEMNNAYREGAQAAQGYRDSKNPYDTALSGCSSIYYWMMDRFHNRGKAGLGLSAMVNGTGFMVSAALLERLGGWRTGTISEDLELTAQCVLAGEKVWWVPQAVTYDEQPVDWAQSIRQRKRWSSGTLQVAQQYLGQLMGRGKENPAAVDVGSVALIPAYQAAALASLLLSVLAACGSCTRPAQAVLTFFGVLLGNLAMGAFWGTLAAALVIHLEGKWDRRLWKGLALYWLFLLSWLPITLGSFVKKTTVWEEIRHTRSVSVPVGP